MGGRRLTGIDALCCCVSSCKWDMITAVYWNNCASIEGGPIGPYRVPAHPEAADWLSTRWTWPGADLGEGTYLTWAQRLAMCDSGDESGVGSGSMGSPPDQDLPAIPGLTIHNFDRDIYEVAGCFEESPAYHSYYGADACTCWDATRDCPPGLIPPAYIYSSQRWESILGVANFGYPGCNGDMPESWWTLTTIWNTGVGCDIFVGYCIPPSALLGSDSSSSSGIATSQIYRVRPHNAITFRNIVPWVWQGYACAQSDKGSVIAALGNKGSHLYIGQSRASVESDVDAGCESVASGSGSGGGSGSGSGGGSGGGSGSGSG